jgi:hypothetical protein
LPLVLGDPGNEAVDVTRAVLRDVRLGPTPDLIVVEALRP